jgi:hypothetical protein
MIEEWLRRRVTVAEAEAAHMVRADSLEPVPFGFLNGRWRELVASMAEGDELWEFRSPPDSWAILVGRGGYCVVRGGRVVGSIVTAMN